MNRRISLVLIAALLVAGPSLLGGCTPTGTSQDLFMIVTGGVQNLLTFVTDFALQAITALLL